MAASCKIMNERPLLRIGGFFYEYFVKLLNVTEEDLQPEKIRERIINNHPTSFMTKAIRSVWMAFVMCI